MKTIATIDHVKLLAHSAGRNEFHTYGALLLLTVQLPENEGGSAKSVGRTMKIDYREFSRIAMDKDSVWIPHELEGEQIPVILDPMNERIEYDGPIRE